MLGLREEVDGEREASGGRSRRLGIPRTGNECFETQVIQADGTLNRFEFDNFLEKVNLAESGQNYAVVSIIGPQSSGKSTLLNHLFGPNFKEMDGLQGRCKVTQGIWLARCAGIEPCTLVMDIEGSDGREREDDTAFERRTGLFALVVSDIVLINMFYTCVGLEHGASKPLLKNVLQGVLRLFGPHKATLVFVIRDLVWTSLLERLKPILLEDIQKIWDSIPKPKHQRRIPLSNFFNIEVVGLPNYAERKEQFKEQVKILRQRFIHSIAPGGLAGDRRDRIRGSDFSLTVQEIWKTIKEDKELDLPNITVLVANIRCEQIAYKKFEDFVANKERLKLEEAAQTKPGRGFRKKYRSMIDSCFHEYDVETAYFDEGVRSEKRKHLEEKLTPLKDGMNIDFVLNIPYEAELVQSAFQSILAHLRSKTLEEFNAAFQNALQTEKDVTVAGHNCKDACMKSFDDICADVIVEESYCNKFEEREKLQRDIDFNVLQAHYDKKKRHTAAKKRCGQIADEKFEAFVANKERLKLEEGAQTKPGRGFMKKYSSMIDSCFHEYDVETAYFDEGVRSEKRKHLKEKLTPLVRSDFQSILAHLRSKTLEEFNVAFQNALKKKKDVMVAGHNCKDACMKSFDDICADVIFEVSYCNKFEEREKLQREIDFNVLKAHYDKKKKSHNAGLIAAGVAGGAILAVGGAVSAVAVGGGAIAAGAIAGIVTTGGAIAKAVKDYNSK